MNYLMYFTKQAMSSDPLLSEFVNCIAFQLCFLRVLYDVSRYVKNNYKLYAIQYQTVYFMGT